MGRDRSPSVRLGAGLLAGAGVLAAIGLLTVPDAPTVRTQAVPARIESPVTTSPARRAPATTPPDTMARSAGEPTVSAGSGRGSPAPPTTVTPATTTLPVSPLVAQLPPRESALVEPSEPVRTPSRLRIGALSVDVPVRAVGLELDGQLEIPDETEAGWYRLGSSPGRDGSTVIAAHVSWNDTTGPFFRLADLELGSPVELELDDGSTRQYVVVERAQYGKLALPQDRIWTHAGDETLVLITCGGEFNREIRRYTDNIVVYAAPATDGG